MGGALLVTWAGLRVMLLGLMRQDQAVPQGRAMLEVELRSQPGVWPASGHTPHMVAPPPQDVGDVAGKRRADNGDDGLRWKLTDEQAPAKKKGPPAMPPGQAPPPEDPPNPAHKRKKERDPPAPDAGARKKVRTQTPGPPSTTQASGGRS